MPGHEWYGNIRSQPCGILCTKTKNGRKRILYKMHDIFPAPYNITTSKMKTATLSILMLAVTLLACNNGKEKNDNGAFMGEENTKSNEDYDLQEIEESGELIIATMSGPDTYYDYQGHPMGLQYALAADFANREGLGVRVETAHDTLELIKMLQNGDADIIALPLPTRLIKEKGLKAAGATDKSGEYSWAVKTESKKLAEALEAWNTENPIVSVSRKEQQRYEERHQVRRTVHAPYVSREKGIISTFDNHFKQAASTTGWDWKLIAAQCYQESGFDPNAVSWAGARGLMQIMPQTAATLGISADQLYSPETNINAAARYIKILSSHFSDIRSREERVKFVLAAYNGGQGHIRDAMALARKYGHDATRWDDVSVFVKKLSDVRYYRDPTVKYGYMIGNETYDYVSKVLERYRSYGGNIHSSANAPSKPSGNGGKAAHKRNKYSKERKILTPEEMADGNIH